jgi:hypothetical protein
MPHFDGNGSVPGAGRALASNPLATLILAWTASRVLLLFGAPSSRREPGFGKNDSINISAAAAKIWNNAMAEVVVEAREERPKVLLEAPAC